MGQSNSTPGSSSGDISKDFQHCITKHTLNGDGSRGAYGDAAFIGCMVDRTADRIASKVTGVSAGDSSTGRTSSHSHENVQQAIKNNHCVIVNGDKYRDGKLVAFTTSSGSVQRVRTNADRCR